MPKSSSVVEMPCWFSASSTLLVFSSSRIMADSVTSTSIESGGTLNSASRSHRKPTRLDDRISAIDRLMAIGSGLRPSLRQRAWVATAARMTQRSMRTIWSLRSAAGMKLPGMLWPRTG